MISRKHNDEAIQKKGLTVRCFVSLVFLFMTGNFLIADSEHNPTSPDSPTANRPVFDSPAEQREGSSFQQCEKKVQSLLPKYLRGPNNQMTFHIMLACAGLEGDPFPRKGWKSYLPVCPAHPPSGDNWKMDQGSSVSQFHNCSDSCFRHSSRKSWKEIISEEMKAAHTLPAPLKKEYSWYNKISAEDLYILKRHYPGQQCCYYRGKLVTDGPGAGTPDVIFMAPNLAPKRLRPTGPLRAALFHDKFDVEIIKTSFPHWPKGWKDYWDLGWGPLPTQVPKFWGMNSNRRSCESYEN